MYSIQKYNPIKKLDWYVIGNDQDTAQLLHTTVQFSGQSVLPTLACEYLVCITVLQSLLNNVQHAKYYYWIMG